MSEHRVVELQAEIERLRALVQQHNDAVWVGLERAKDVRNAAIEECAQVAESWMDSNSDLDIRVVAKLAAAIRALKEK